MKTFALSLLCLVIVNLQFLNVASVSASSTQEKHTTAPKYDPKRDPEKDIQDAIAGAARTGKRILLEVGGEWCSWCHTLDRYFESNPQLLQLRDRNYVTVKINWSPENMNEKVH